MLSEMEVGQLVSDVSHIKDTVDRMESSFGFAISGQETRLRALEITEGGNKVRFAFGVGAISVAITAFMLTLKHFLGIGTGSP